MISEDLPFQALKQTWNDQLTSKKLSDFWIGTERQKKVILLEIIY